MKGKRMIRLLTMAVAVTLCLTSLSVTAFAGGADGEPYYTEPEATEEVTGGKELEPLTPDGNMTLVDDIDGEAAEDKQFITVVTKTGNYFYVIIDRAENGENTVHFLNQVDEADLMALMDDGKEEPPATCSCAEKCQAGAVNMACPVCKVNMRECAGKEPVVEPEPEPEPEKKGSGGLLVVVLLLALAGGGAYAYIKYIKPNQGAKVSSDPDDYDFEDEEYENEDVPEDEVEEEN